MSDLIEKQFNSLIQHGKENDRVYLMKLDVSKLPQVFDYIETLVEKYNYSKVLAKIPAECFEFFSQRGFIKEAFVPFFYKGQVDCVFASKFFSKEREALSNQDDINNVIKVCEAKEAQSAFYLLEGFSFKVLNKNDVPKMTALYRHVFETYPFPIFEDEYILKTMAENLCYFGVEKDNNLVSICSSEMDKDSLNSEMTDFATLEEFRGLGLPNCLLSQMELDLKDRKFKTAYTIARAASFGMNIVFKKAGYVFAGTLKNNSNIGGSLESMNVWYKNI